MTARLVTASDGALLGFGLVFGIAGHWLGWVIAAGGALIMALNFLAARMTAPVRTPNAARPEGGDGEGGSA
jgi:hypothetical protein